MKAGDFVELVENDVFKERLYPIIMSSKDKIMIEISIGDEYLSLAISKKLVLNHITKDKFKEMQEESLVFEPLLQEYFNTFDA